MHLTRHQIEQTKSIVRGAIKAYETMGWVRVHTFSDEKGRYVSVMHVDRPRVKAASLMGALILGFDGTELRPDDRYVLDTATYCVTRSLPKEYQSDPLGIYNWNDKECKSRSQAVRLLQTVLHRLESV